jgi:hypothetical protein
LHLTPFRRRTSSQKTLLRQTGPEYCDPLAGASWACATAQGFKAERSGSKSPTSQNGQVQAPGALRCHRFRFGLLVGVDGISSFRFPTLQRLVDSNPSHEILSGYAGLHRSFVWLDTILISLSPSEELDFHKTRGAFYVSDIPSSCANQTSQGKVLLQSSSIIAHSMDLIPTGSSLILRTQAPHTEPGRHGL